jgi:hypothetical protein
MSAFCALRRPLSEQVAAQIGGGQQVIRVARENAGSVLGDDTELERLFGLIPDRTGSGKVYDALRR